MITFFACLALLIVGYFVYGTIVNKVFKPDDRATPVTIHPDGVDYCPMKTWRIFLIQLLNIAGLGPIFGALAGACWGPVVYLWIVFGTILGGGVHDYMSGMMSIRHDGASIAEIVGIYLGKAMKFIMRVFSVVLLLLVGTTFSTGPANLLAMLTPEKLDKTFWLVLILIYYLLATFLPIDKIIGKLYPIFGIALIVMAVGIAGGIIVGGYAMPELTMEAFTVVHPGGLPKWAMMFVTVACGAISGFHATQSPMMARCMASEKDGQKIFYGAMVAEGIIALIWAAAGVAFYNGLGGGIGLSGAMAGLSGALKEMGQGGVVYFISTSLLGPVGGALALIGVIACPITSGDTAFRSCRLTIADWFHIDQSKIWIRLACSAPLLIIGATLSQLDFQVIWRYFAWSNQTLAMMTLWAGAVYLYKNCSSYKFGSLIAALPATFMSAVSVTYILQAPEGFKLSTSIAYPVGLVFAAACLGVFLFTTFLRKKDPAEKIAA
ncbi:MAG: carbon starvation CstA family protein [Pseudoflavonifractor sp.]